MTRFEEITGLEENHHLAAEAEKDLLEKIQQWRQNGCNFDDLAQAEGIRGELLFLTEKGDHQFSPELVGLLRENRILLSVNSDVKYELDKILDKN